MGSLFRQVFTCCIRPRSHSPHEPDEHTHLIRPSDDLLPPPTNNVVDHHKLRERLGRIVRSKEGKMVNVHVQLPFNLQNRPPSQYLEASSSRSTRSRSLNPYASPPPPIITAITDDLNVYTSQPDALRPQFRSSSPTQGNDHSPSLQTSRSTSSLHPGDPSYIPELDADGTTRRPILNARLVKVNAPGALNGRKGRSVVRGRLGRFEAQRAASSLNQDGADTAEVGQATTGNGAENEENGLNVQGSSAANSPADSSNGDNTPDPVSLTQGLDFKIQPVGKIARSWGD